MDKSYWSKFYANHKVGEKPSLFAEFVWENYLKEMSFCAKSAPISSLRGFEKAEAIQKNQRIDGCFTSFANPVDCHDLPNGKSRNDKNNIAKKPQKQKHILRLIELGCGNGRDALFFAKNGIATTAIDQVQDEIAYLATHCATTTNGTKNPHFIAGDFTNLDEIFKDSNTHPNNTQCGDIAFDCIYSRFTLHSITHNQQENLISQIPKFIAPNGILAIEARGKKNSLYKQGRAVDGEANAFIHDNHYRRFVDFDNLCEVLESQLNLKIHFAKEDRGFAPFNGEDDYFFRVVGIARHERERERVKRATRFVVFIAFAKLDSSDKGVSYVA